MTTRDKVLREMHKSKPLRATELADKFGVSRQTVSNVLRNLVEEGVLIREGATRGASYRPARPGAKRSKGPDAVSLVKQLKGLSEQRVWVELESKLPMDAKLNSNARSIVAYAFTEMLNNAIDHSKSKDVSIEMKIDRAEISFSVRDKGVGIFYNIRQKFKLEDEFAGLEHVLKGKQTTAPEAHSGEGIFFTSRIADCFTIRSHALKVRFDNTVPDSFVSQEKQIKGTEVQFVIKSQTKKKLEKLFAEYANEDFQFDKNTVRIKISSYSGALSRSQARRLLHGLEKYDRLIFDFSGVKEIGQGFADEVFRVFVLRHAPRILVDYANADEAVEFMIRRAKKG